MATFREGFVTLNYVPIHVMTWGGWIEDAPSSSWREIIIMFTGNPGVASFYYEFCEKLYEAFKIPVWVVSLAGHEIPPNDSSLMPNINNNTHLYDLNGQIKSKKELFRRFVPEGCKVHLLGHSVGGFMALELLKDDDVADKVQHSYLLFPVLENITETKNGRFLNAVIFKILWLVYFAAGFFLMLPHFLKVLLLSIYAKIVGMRLTPSNRKAIISLINPTVLQSVFDLAKDEMIVIKGLEVDLIKKRKDKILVYYSDHDGWAPVSHYENLVRAVPGVEAEICKKGLDHAFMLYRPITLMAEILIERINKYRVK